LIERGNPERISSTDLCKALLVLPDRPWAEIGRAGKGLTTNTLSRRLKSFGIRSKQRRIGDANVKGYAREDFVEAFERYIPADTENTSDQTETSKQVNEINVLDNDQNETGQTDCFGLESRNNPELQGCFDVSDGIRVSEAEEMDEGVV